MSLIWPYRSLSVYTAVDLTSPKISGRHFTELVSSREWFRRMYDARSMVVTSSKLRQESNFAYRVSTIWPIMWYEISGREEKLLSEIDSHHLFRIESPTVELR